ncbi:hypothetical protein MY4824_006565 [Beauveria thailandica]
MALVPSLTPVVKTGSITSKTAVGSLGFTRDSSEPNPVCQAQNNAKPVPKAASTAASTATACLESSPAQLHQRVGGSRSHLNGCLVPRELHQRVRGSLSRLNSCLNSCLNGCLVPRELRRRARGSLSRLNSRLNSCLSRCINSYINYIAGLG